MGKIKYDLVSRTSPVELPENLIFGRNFSDHMLIADYNPSEGWHNVTITKVKDLQLSPAAMCLHYGQEIFEGMKAYKHQNGKIALFRPEENFKRMNRSAERLCMAQLDVDEMLEALVELVKVDKDWIPTKPGHSLYIRPTMISTDPFLGVRPSDTYKFFVLLSPVGPYYPEGFKPVPILATDEYVRAVRKGVGYCKAAGNYAASLMAQAEAKKQGYTQVLWLDAIEQRYIEEVGTSNIFIRFKDEVATSGLTGSILPGVTRMSVIQILRDWGYKVNERNIDIQEVIDGYKDGNLVEIFGAGTAAVISSVGKLKFKDHEMVFDMDNAGELSKKLYAEITGIQYGIKEDKYNWLKFVE